MRGAEREMPHYLKTARRISKMHTSTVKCPWRSIGNICPVLSTFQNFIVASRTRVFPWAILSYSTSTLLVWHEQKQTKKQKKSQNFLLCEMCPLCAHVLFCFSRNLLLRRQPASRSHVDVEWKDAASVGENPPVIVIDEPHFETVQRDSIRSRRLYLPSVQPFRVQPLQLDAQLRKPLRNAQRSRRRGPLCRASREHYSGQQGPRSGHWMQD